MVATQLDASLLASLHASAAASLGDDVAVVFAAAMTRTLDRAVRIDDDGAPFVLTGDIPAMWLRDSAAQMRPYVAICHLDPALADLIAGIVRTQARQIIRDPYANAFNDGPTDAGHIGDLTARSAWIWERKYEVDSLAFPLQLAYQLWAATGRTDHLDEALVSAARSVIETVRTEQDHPARSGYSFERLDGPRTDTLVGGHGSPVAVTGMTWSGFRPSDDACRYHYNVPGNLFMAQSLRNLAELADGPLASPDLAADAVAVAAELEAAVAAHGVVDHPVHGRIWAYEVDGLGHHLLMDDANMPSLLSLPLTGGIAVDDPLYRATRSFVLSDDNPTFVRGATGDGLGSPHTPDRYVWPIAAAVRGLTSTEPEQRAALLRQLVDVAGPRARMSESYDVDDPTAFTREWFSWADSMFCELVLDELGHTVPGRRLPAAVESPAAHP